MEICQWTSLISFFLSGSGYPDNYLYEIGRFSQILWLRTVIDLTQIFVNVG